MGNKVRIIEYIRDADSPFLICRSFNHMWDDRTSQVEATGSEIYVRLECARCATARVQVIDREGYTQRNYYTYPAGYIMSGLAALIDKDGRALLRYAAVQVLAGS